MHALCCLAFAFVASSSHDCLCGEGKRDESGSQKYRRGRHTRHVTGKLRRKEEKERNDLLDDQRKRKLYHTSFSSIIFSIVNGYSQENHGRSGPPYIYMHVCGEGTSGKRRKRAEWKGYVRTATIRADQKPVGALVRILVMKFDALFFARGYKHKIVFDFTMMIRQLFVSVIEGGFR